MDLPAAHDTAFMTGKLWWGVCVNARVEFCVRIVLFSYLEDAVCIGYHVEV